MILKLLVIVLSVIVVCFIINAIEDYRNYTKNSFKESMTSLNVPIVSFNCNGKDLNFLLDSGSSYSHISTKAAISVNGKIEKIETVKTVGAGDNIYDSSHCILKLEQNNKFFNSDFIVSEQVERQFEVIEKDFNIKIHGVLGNDFLKRYNYIIDFKNLVTYSKSEKK